MLIDSLTVDDEFDEFEEEYPADYLYSGEWDNSTLNPYKIQVTSLPDTFVVNCSDFFPPVESVIGSEYGPRKGRFHSGIDFRSKMRDTVRCAFDGKIRIANAGKTGYGHFVVVRHDNGLETLYGHLSKILVSPNQIVKAGEVIALVGSTGRSTGPHLHFEMRFLGNAFDPRKIVDFDNFVVYNDTYIIRKQETFSEMTTYINRPANYYKVKEGDTLSKIAKNNRTTVDRLKRLNKLGNSSIIRPGQSIRVS